MQRGFSTFIFILVGLLVFGGVFSGGYYFYQQQKLKSITDFESCAKYFPVLTSYPGQCNTSDGRHFVQQLSEEEKSKLIPPSEPRLAWKAYRDESTGFEFTYPKTWSYLNKYGYITFGELTTINHIGEKVEPYPIQFVTVTVSSLKPGETIEEAKNLSSDLNTKWEDVKIAGLNAKRVSHMECVSGECTDVIFSKNNKMVDFSIENSKNPEFQKYLNEVTANFKFLH